MDLLYSKEGSLHLTRCSSRTSQQKPTKNNVHRHFSSKITILFLINSMSGVSQCGTGGIHISNDQLLVDHQQSEAIQIQIILFEKAHDSCDPGTCN
jgi:hypothetical protein